MSDNDFDLLRAGKLPSHIGMKFTKAIHSTVYPAIDPSTVHLPDGYTVIVTGAGKGIGEFIAKAFAEAKAANIIITARTSSDLDRVKAEIEKAAESSINVTTVPSDATDPESYVKLAELINTKFDGRLDCLVCNAGGGSNLSTIFSDKIHGSSALDITDCTNLNFLSAYYAAKYLIPVMLNPQSTGKMIINITSAASHFSATPSFAYSIAKLALNRLTETIANNYQKDGLLGVAMHPGGVITPGVEAVLPDHLKDLLQDDIRLCGAVCVWLASRKPNWLSGRYMMAAWDVEELEAVKEEIVEKDKLKFKMVV